MSSSAPTPALNPAIAEMLAKMKGESTTKPEVDEAIAKVVEKSKSSTLVTFYSRGDGSRYCFEDGGIAEFKGGFYEFDPAVIPDDYIAAPAKAGQPQITREDGWKRRFEELTYVCKIPNPVFSSVLVPVHKSDAHVMREVGQAAGGIGLVGSFQAGSNLKQSN